MLKKIGIFALIAIVVILLIKFIWNVMMFLLPIAIFGAIVWWIIKLIRKQANKV